MTVSAIKSAIVKIINDSNYEINLIKNKKNGLEIDIQKTNKYGYHNTIKTLLCDENDLKEFRETVGLK